MRNSIKRNVALWMAFFFLFSISGCGGGGGGGSESTGTDNSGTDSASQTADLQEHLTTFNLAMGWITEDLPAMADTVNQLNTAIAEDDGSAEKTVELDFLVDSFGLDLDMLTADAETMEAAEAGIQGITNPATSITSFAVAPVIGVGLAIAGLYAYIKALRGHREEAVEELKVRKKALVDTSNGVAGAEKRYTDSQKKLVDIGAKTIKTVTKKVVTVTIPGNPTSTTGVLLKEGAGNAVEKGLDVLSATNECENGDSPDCKIGVSKTDQAGSAFTPDGDVTIVVGGGDMAREVVKEEISPGSFTEVTIDPIPIDEATPQKIADSDNSVTGDTDTGDNDTGDTDTGDDDTPVTPTMTLSASVSSENDSNITYSVSAVITGITDSTTVTIIVEHASTGTSTKTLTADGSVVWSVIVTDEDATVTVRRSDTGDQESLTLSAKTAKFDGTYEGLIITTFQGADNNERICFCFDSYPFRIIVSGSSLSGDVTGTLSGNQVSGVDNEYGMAFSGSISGNVMSGTWNDSGVGCCSGTFSFTKQ